MGPPNVRGNEQLAALAKQQHVRMNEAMDKMGWKKQDFEDMSKKYKLPPKKLVETILGPGAFVEIGANRRVETDKNPATKSSSKITIDGSNINIEIPNINKYISRISGSHTIDKTKDVSSYEGIQTKIVDVSERISADLELQGLYIPIKMIYGELTKHKDKFIDDYGESSTKSNTLNLGFEAGDNHNISVDYTRFNPQREKSESTTSIKGSTNIQNVKVGAGFENRPGSENRTSNIGVTHIPTGASASFEHVRRGQGTQKNTAKISVQKKIGMIPPFSATYSTDSTKNKTYGFTLGPYDKSNINLKYKNPIGQNNTFEVGTTYVPEYDDGLIPSLIDKITAQYIMNQRNSDPVHTFKGDLKKGPLNLSVGVRPKSKRHPNTDVTAKFGWKTKFDNGGFVDIPIENQLVSTEHDPNSWNKYEQIEEIDFSNLDTRIGTWALKPLLDMGVNEEELREVLKGETTSSKPLAYRLQEPNKSGTTARGLFQFVETTANWLGTTTENIAKMNLPEQISLYKKYLKKHKWKPGIPLAMMQAAPSYAKKPDNFVVYTKEKNPEKYKNNLVWVPLDKNGKRIKDAPITVKSIKDYYKRQK